jgi:hypothetical protein
MSADFYCQILNNPIQVQQWCFIVEWKEGATGTLP